MRLEGLRKRLEGTYDLDKVEDCQRVIEVLLRGSDRANVTVAKAREELKALALDVVNERIEAKERAAVRATRRPEKTPGPRPTAKCSTSDNLQPACAIKSGIFSNSNSLPRRC